MLEYKEKRIKELDELINNKEIELSNKEEKEISKDKNVFLYDMGNAKYIDTERKLLDNVPEPYKTLFLGPLLYEASNRTNTSGVFKGFYKKSETNIGQFEGDAYFNHEADKGEPSEWIGCSIAEDRAMIKYTNKRIELKKAEIKGLERFVKSYYKDPKTQAKAKNLLKAMNRELEELLYEREE